MTRLLAIALLCTACSTPPLALALAVSGAPSDSCGATSCADVHLSCQSVASIRILDPNDPLEPYIHMCVTVVPDKDSDLCSLASINLDQIPLPEQTLEVEVVVFPLSDVTDPVTGDIVCPADVAFDAVDGFPISPLEIENTADSSTFHTVHPAIGGRAFYHAGDSQVVVELGCPDLGALNSATCVGGDTIAVTATVLDFDTQQSVSTSVGNMLDVSIGEPKPAGAEYTLNSANTARLANTVQQPDPAWGGNVDLMFVEAACLEVLEDVPDTTSTLTCVTTNGGNPVSQQKALDFSGFRLENSDANPAVTTLQKIVTALGSPDLSKGLVVGVVLDDLGNLAPGFTVNPCPTAVNCMPTTMNGTVQYLSADGKSFGGTKTTASGIFISNDAPFNTYFVSTNSAATPPATVSGFGGLVDDKVTIVVLQFSPPNVGGT